MRKSLKCPKCDCRKLWHIEKVRHFNTYADGALLNVVHEKRVGKPDNGFFGTGERKKMNVGTYDVFVCFSCGYTEWYAGELEQLEENPEEGVHLIDGETRNGAFR